MGPVRVLIVDDHEVVRHGLQTLLQRRGHLVVGQAATAAEAVDKAAASKPDVVIMDIRLPDDTGINACRAIRAGAPETRVLMLTSYSEREAIMGSILAGASGFLMKEIGGDELVAAVEKVARGQSLLDPGVTHTVLAAIRTMGAAAVDDRLGQLSAQELKILELVAEGRTNKEIGAQVSLSYRTVKNYVSNILGKLGLQRRAELAAYVARGHPRL